MPEINHGEVLERTLTAEGHPVFQRLILKYDESIKTSNFLWMRRLQDIEGEQWANLPPICTPSIDLSAVFVVKNEDRTILAALTSIARHVGEIIVVDTGSTDNTIKIVKRHLKIPESNKPSGIKLYKKEFVPWSFSEAKNFGISKATRNYIWIIDGDEPVDQVPEFTSMRETVYHVKIINCPERTQARIPRIFPNDLNEYYFKSDIHNELVYPSNAVHVAPRNLSSLHWPGVSKSKAESREQRYEDFLKKYTDKPLKSFDDYWMIAKIAFDSQSWRVFDKYWREGYALFTVLPEEVKRSRSDYLLFNGMAAVTRKKYDSWFIPEHISLVGEKVDNQFCSFTYHYSKGNFEQALYHAIRYMALCKTEPDEPFTAQASIPYYDVMQFKINALDFHLEREKSEA